ncbi:Retrovirus-related Pol polyprotein from transposon RE2 [Araneus ventricosus]|uniref:Retrovirus-related Pol polyprotein from transposon RE2 n=1 Tax=Araneus ventricosus TaxID=182803 RepID=A0A4Y2NEX7_ARAVE|nr:Retrovirus-related Pol polyprotein from transposon RE2 [Araneus ventricosus]
MFGVFGVDFSVKHFKRIGCVTYVFIPKRYKNKLEPNAQKGIMMGYALNTLGYRIFFPQSGKITETKHIKFNESILGVDSNVQMKDNKFRMVDSFSDFELSSNETPMPKLSDKTECDWKRVCVTRQKDKSKGRIDVYYYPESKVRLRSKNEVKKYCENIEDISDSEAHLVDIKIPNNFKESQMVPERENWCSAMKEELEILKARDVYEIVPRPENKNVLGNKTRPDIMFAANFLSQFNNNPSITHWNLICQVFHYVLNTSNYEINLSRSESFALTAYTDASWAADKMDRKSISGYVIVLGDFPVSWSTSKQKCAALSSMELNI